MPTMNITRKGLDLIVKTCGDIIGPRVGDQIEFYELLIEESKSKFYIPRLDKEAVRKAREKFVKWLEEK